MKNVEHNCKTKWNNISDTSDLFDMTSSYRILLFGKYFEALIMRTPVSICFHINNPGHLGYVMNKNKRQLQVMKEGTNSGVVESIGI